MDAGFCQSTCPRSFLEDVVPAVPASTYSVQRQLDSSYAVYYIYTTAHRTKNPTMKPCFNAMVSRPVTRKEMISNPKAMEAFMKKERIVVRKYLTSLRLVNMTTLWPKQRRKVSAYAWLAYMDSSMRRRMIQPGSSKGEECYP